MPVTVSSFRTTLKFEADFKAAPADVQSDAQEALRKLLTNPSAGALRLHSLKGYKKPTVMKIDVRPDHSWQITFELDGIQAVLLRLGTHKVIDRQPR